MENKWAITALKKKPKSILICDPKYPRPHVSVWLKTPGCKCLSHTVLFIKKKKKREREKFLPADLQSLVLIEACSELLRLSCGQLEPEWHSGWVYDIPAGVTQLPAEQSTQRLWVRWYLVKHEQMIATEGQQSRVDHPFLPRQFYNVPPPPFFFSVCMNQTTNLFFCFFFTFSLNCLWNVLTGCQSRPEDSPW